MVQVGDVYSRHSFGRVVGITPYDGVVVQNEAGRTWSIGRDIFEAECHTATDVKEELEGNRTSTVQALLAAPFMAATVIFRKQVDPNDVADALVEGAGEANKRDWRRKVKEVLAGETRVMVGYHRGQLDEHGRLKFTEVGVGDRVIDPRTIEQVIVGGKKYTVK